MGAASSSVPVHATRSIQDEALRLLKQAFEATENPAPIALWWDEGGHLEEVVREATQQLDGTSWRKADGLPLSLRRYVEEDAAGPSVWYVPEAKNRRDWFRDIAAADGEIEQEIVELAAHVYGVPSWELIDFDVSEEEFGDVARVLRHQLTRRHRPSLAELREELLTQGHGSPLDRLLIADWGAVPEESGVLESLHRRLEEEGVPELTDDDDPAALAGKSRRWAVALWLQESGISPAAFPEAYRSESALHSVHKRLGRRMMQADSDRVERIYLHERWWPDLIEGIEDPVRFASCPVDGALDARLWNEWDARTEEGDWEGAAELAWERVEALAEVYRPVDGQETVFASCWRQAHEVAELGGRYEVLAGALDAGDVIEVYGGAQDGAWRVEAAVRRLVVSGRPEEGLPAWHPGADLLVSRRESMLGERYLTHLDELADKTREAVRGGSFFSETHVQSVTEFWSKSGHLKELAVGEEVALVFVDGLRLDLARELADRLRTALAPDAHDGAAGERDQQGWDVREHLWLATVPSETEAGMGALLPGSSKAFSVDVADGKLRARRSQRYLSTDFRRDVLEREGWSVTDRWESGWEAPRVAFFDSDIDEGGEADIEEIERHLARRVDELTNRIQEKLHQGDWSKAFVLTDHGFVLLPPDTTMEPLAPPESAEAVSRRYTAPAGSGDDPGVVLKSETQGLDYLETSVRTLIHPRQRFRKQGIGDRRYFHGGLMPQESVLLFLEIERS